MKIISLNSILSIPLVLLFLTFLSCDEEAKNESRDNIGAFIPKNEEAIVVDKYTDSPGGETRYFILNKQLSNGKECTDLVTYHDFKFVKIGDTLSNNSARPYCLKVYGEPCEGSYWRNFRLIALIIVFIGIPAFVYFIYGEIIDELFKTTWLGKVWYTFTGFLDNILNVNYGLNVFILTIFLVEGLVGIVLWSFGLEMNDSLSIQYVVTRLIVLTVIALVSLWSIGGLDNLMRNLMVVAIGTILVSLMTLLFANSGMKYKNMIKILLKPSDG